MPPHEMRGEIERLTERYGIMEGRVEKNASQASTTQDQPIRKYSAGRGCLISGHHTNSNQWDPGLRRGFHGEPSKGDGTATT